MGKGYEMAISAPPGAQDTAESLAAKAFLIDCSPPPVTTPIEAPHRCSPQVQDQPKQRVERLTQTDKAAKSEETQRPMYHPSADALKREFFTDAQISQLNPRYSPFFTSDLKTEIDWLAQSPRKNIKELKSAYEEYIARHEMQYNAGNLFSKEMPAAQILIDALTKNRDVKWSDKEKKLVHTDKKIDWDRADTIHGAIVDGFRQAVDDVALRRRYADLLLSAGETMEANEQNKIAMQKLDRFKTTIVVDGKSMTLWDQMMAEARILYKDTRDVMFSRDEFRRQQFGLKMTHLNKALITVSTWMKERPETERKFQEAQQKDKG